MIGVLLAAAASPTWAGSLPTWLLFVLATFAAWRLSKGGAGSAVSELSKANEVLTARVHELGGEVRDLRVENAQLRERTDVALALVPAVREIVSSVTETIAAHETRGLAALEQHEKRADSRFKSSLKLLDLIAQRLGPEPNGLPA